MVKTEKITVSGGMRVLCRTYSDVNLRLKQSETGVIYGSDAVDSIEGYDENGLPFSRFNYTETDEYEITAE